jgi:signal transduction histidine kinase
MSGRRVWRWWWLGLLIAISTVLAGCDTPEDAAAALHLRSAQRWSAPGQGYTRPPMDLAHAGLSASGWAPVALPDLGARELLPQAQGGVRTLTDWYRLDLSQLPASTAPRYLYIPRWKTIGQIAVYGEDALLYASEGSKTHNGYNHPLLIPLNPGAGQAAPRTVTLRIDRLQSSGSALSTIWAGEAGALVWRYQLRQLLQTQLPFIGGAAFLAVGLFSLGVWLRLRRDSLYLLFFATSAVAFVRMLHYHIGGSHLPVNDEWFEWITVASLMWLLVLCHLFMERLHQRPLRGLTPALLSVTLLCNAATLPGMSAALPQLTLYTPLLYLLLLPLAVLIFFDALRNGFRMNSREIWLMPAWLFATTLGCVYDLALQNNRVSPEGMYTNPYAIIGLFAMFLYIMFRRYVGAVDTVERANEHLALALQNREAELAASYARLREVERRQTLSDERLRLTQDMHDGLGSSLVTALRVVESGHLTELDLGAVLKGCIDDLKLTIDSMEPVEADLLLLLATLRFRLGPRFKAAGISLKWEVQNLPKLEWLSPRNALHILRIFQEAFANILKHTHASEIRVRTRVAGLGVEVTVEDNGQGFDLEQALRQPTGRGLDHQLRRAKAIQGDIQWQSGPAGTCMCLWLPLTPPRVG